MNKICSDTNQCCTIAQLHTCYEWDTYVTPVHARKRTHAPSVSFSFARKNMQEVGSIENPSAPMRTCTHAPSGEGLAAREIGKWNLRMLKGVDEFDQCHEGILKDIPISKIEGIFSRNAHRVFATSVATISSTTRTCADVKLIFVRVHYSQSERNELAFGTAWKRVSIPGFFVSFL